MKLIGIMLIFSFIACDFSDSKRENFKSNSDKPQKSSKNPDEKFEKHLKQFSSINYNSKTKQFSSDTISNEGFKYVVFGKINMIGNNRASLGVSIDSVKVVEPGNSLLRDYGMGGFLYRHKKYSFDHLVRIKDCNDDGQKDIIIIDGVSSKINGGQLIFNLFKNINNKFSIDCKMSEYDIYRAR